MTIRGRPTSAWSFLRKFTKRMPSILPVKLLNFMSPRGLPALMGGGRPRGRIHKVNRRPQTTRFGPQAGKRLIQVLLHLFGIALVAPVNRSLRAQPQMLEQAAHSTLAHFHAVLLL